MDHVGTKIIGFAGQDINVLAVIAVEPEVGGDPCITALVLYNGIDKAVGQAIIGGYVLYFPGIRSVLINLSEKGGWDNQVDEQVEGDML